MNADELRNKFNECLNQLRQIQNEKLGIIELGEKTENNKETDNSKHNFEEVIENIKEIRSMCQSRKEKLNREFQSNKQENYLEQKESLNKKYKELMELQILGLLTNKNEINETYTQIARLEKNYKNQQDIKTEISKLNALLDDIAQENLQKNIIFGEDISLDYKCPLCDSKLKSADNKLICNDCDFETSFFEYDDAYKIHNKEKIIREIKNNHPKIIEKYYKNHNQDNLEIILDKKSGIWIVIPKKVKNYLKNTDEPLEMIKNKKIAYFEIFKTKDECVSFIENNFEKVKDVKIKSNDYQQYIQNEIEAIYDKKSGIWVAIPKGELENIKNSDEIISMIMNGEISYFGSFETKIACENFIKLNFKETRNLIQKNLEEETKTDIIAKINKSETTMKIEKIFYGFYSSNEIEAIYDKKSGIWVAIPKGELENIKKSDEIISMIMNGEISYFGAFETMFGCSDFINANFSPKEAKQRNSEKINIECPYCNNTFSQDRGIDVICPSCGIEMSYPQYNKLFAEQDKQKVAKNIMNLYKEKVIPKKDYAKYKKNKVTYEENEIFKVWFVKIKENINEEEERFFAVFSTEEECQKFIKANFEKSKKKIKSKTKEKILLKHHLSNMTKFFKKIFSNNKEKNNNKKETNKHQLCPGCQAPINYENAKFCGKCGTPLEQKFNEEQRKGRKK